MKCRTSIIDLAESFWANSLQILEERTKNRTATFERACVRILHTTVWLISVIVTRRSYQQRISRHTEFIEKLERSVSGSQNPSGEFQTASLLFESVILLHNIIQFVTTRIILTTFICCNCVGTRVESINKVYIFNVTVRFVLYQ